ncbi:MAG: hypothetical protein ACPG49_04925 [Chitinophagales bacterium]
MTFFQGALIYISLLIIAPPIFYLVAVVGGTYYQSLVGLFLILAMAIIFPFMILAHILAVKSPLSLIGIDVLFAFGTYYFVNIWNPYPTRDELVYQDDLQLFGNVKTYEEEHYKLSGEVSNPQKGGKLQEAITVSFNENGDKTKDESTYRSSPLERDRISTNTYTYNDKQQLIRKNDNIIYTYDVDGELWKILEERTSFFKNRRTDYQTKTTYTYNNISRSLIEEEKNRFISYYSILDTSYRNQTRKTIFNENGHILYEGEVKEGDFFYNVKNTYNELNQLVFKREVGYHEKETTYEYDDSGFLKKEKNVSFREDTTKLNTRKVIEYDNWGQKVYESDIWYYHEADHPNAPQTKRQFFMENEYDSLQNLIRKTIFIKENDEPKEPYYLVEIDLTYYQQ